MIKANTQGWWELRGCQSVLSLRKMYWSLVLCVAGLLISGLLRLIFKTPSPRLQLRCDVYTLMWHTLTWLASGSSSALGMKNNLCCVVFRARDRFTSILTLLRVILHCFMVLVRLLQMCRSSRLWCVLDVSLVLFLHLPPRMPIVFFFIYIVWRKRMKSRNLWQ